MKREGRKEEEEEKDFIFFTITRHTFLRKDLSKQIFLSCLEVVLLQPPNQNHEQWLQKLQLVIKHEFISSTIPCMVMLQHVNINFKKKYQI